MYYGKCNNNGFGYQLSEREIKYMSKENRSKILALYKILIKKSDENHKLSITDIEDLLSEKDLYCHRDSIRRYIKQLENEFDIKCEPKRGRYARYYVGNRLLENSEMRLVMDAIYSSNFIEKKNAMEMIRKLKSTISEYEEEKIFKRNLGLSVNKTENSNIFNNVANIQEALEKKCQISFEYMKWTKDKELKKQGVKNYLYPWELFWAYDRYYIYGYKVDLTNGVLEERTYRVDKMEDIEVLLDKPRKENQRTQSFDVNTFVSRRIMMYSEKERYITVRISPHLVGAFIDQFGKDEVEIKEEKDGKLLVSFWAANSPLLHGWLIGLESAEVIRPEDVRAEFIKLIENQIKKYNLKNGDDDIENMDD